MRNFIVTIEGKQYQVGVEEVAQSSFIQSVPIQPVASASVAAPVVSATPIVSAPPKTQVSDTNGVKLNSPMPGMVKKLVLSEGSQVKKGQAVVVLETMKMENDIISPSDGVISYKTTVGTNIESGELLAVIV